MVAIGDILNLDSLDELLVAGYVRRGEHPTEPLSILNYTAACQYDRAWTDETRQCRGLIVHRDTGQIVARPFPKFHNYGEHQHRVEEVVRDDIPRAVLGLLDLEAPCVVTDKLDGSLGILYPLSSRSVRCPTGLPCTGCRYCETLHENPGWAIATRGSFTSEQAIHATEVWRSLYQPQMEKWHAPSLTYLFEIIYPDNRIVCDYDGMDNLVLLAAIETETGRASLRPPWPGPRAAEMHYRTLAEALAAEPRPGAEGLVVFFPDTNERVKIKQDEYVALHRILTGTNARNVWEVAAVRACAPLIRDPKHWGSFLGVDPARAEEVVALGDGWLDGVPDEFHEWVRGVLDHVAETAGATIDEAHRLVGECCSIADRRARFEHVAAHPLQKQIMRLAAVADGDDPPDDGWAKVTFAAYRGACPEPTSPFARDEAIA